jgi:cysteinyl-tRNA synthetase
VLCKATDHIPEQIEMIKKLEAKGITYKTTDGIYFDTVAFEKMGFKYGELSTLDQIKFGARLEPNPEKKDPRDFALWKFSPTDGTKRQMEWESPWGVGFPGWHIECSAMSTKYLGDQFDIHVGGEDLRSTHHPNEIAQAEGSSGKHPFVEVWVHGAFLLVDGGRMGKSLGNDYKVSDISAH